MKSRLDRRTVLAAALGMVVPGFLAPAAAAVARRPVAQRLPLTDNLSLISGVGANVLALSSPAGSLLIDTGSAEARAGLRSQVAGLPGKGRVLMVVNTHWHREQSGNNEVFGKSGATIIAHQKTRQRLSTDLWQPEVQQYLRALPRAGWPTRAFYQTETLEFAGERVECGYLLEAHTDGDIYVRLRNANVLAVGDALAANGSDPVLDWFGGGWLGGRIDALAALLKLADADTRVVPAQGPVVSRKELQAEHDMLSALFERLTVMMRKGFTTDDMIASNVLDTTGRRWNDGAKFLYTVHKGLWAHHNTISHDIV